MQGGQGVRRFTGLGDDHEQGIVQQHRFAVAELAGDLGLAGDAGQFFQPVGRDQAGIKAGAAGRYPDGLYLAQDGLGPLPEGVEVDPSVADPPLQRLGDRVRLGKDFLEHVMPIPGLVGHLGIQFGNGNGPLDQRPPPVIEGQPVAADIGHIAVLKKDKTLGDGQ